MAFLYAYVQYLDVSDTAEDAPLFFLIFLVQNPVLFHDANTPFLKVDTYLMLLTTSSDAFYHLKDCR